MGGSGEWCVAGVREGALYFGAAARCVVVLRVVLIGVLVGGDVV